MTRASLHRRLLLFALLIAAAPLVVTVARAADSESKSTTPESPDAGASGGDLVEVLDDSTPSTPANKGEKKSEPAPTATAANRFEFRGFARMTIGAGIASGDAAPAGASSADRVPYDRAIEEQHLFLETRYSRGPHFQVVVSGSLAYAAYLQENRPLETGVAKVEAGNLEPVLREAYLGFYSDHLDVRIGQQRLVWGNSDGIMPNDVINARDLRERLLFDSEITNLPTLAARSDIDLGGVGVLGLVFQPLFTPDQFSFYGTNWAIIQPGAPQYYRRLMSLFSEGRDRSSMQDLQTVLSDAQLPSTVPNAATFGASVKLHFGKADFSYYYHYGFDRSPVVYFDPTLAPEINAVNANQITDPVLNTLISQLRTSSQQYGGPLLLSYVRRHHVGADAATTVGPFVLRLDSSFDSAMVFYSQNTLNSVVKPAAQVVAGIEYQTGDVNKIIVLEGWYQHIVNSEMPFAPVLNQANTGPLLFYNDDSAGISNLLRWVFFDNLIIENRTFVGITPAWYTVRPEIGYTSADLTIRLGAMLIGGGDNSYGNYYNRNSTVYVTSRYTF